MVIASHDIFTFYGFWLPNDPRGSWSVRSQKANTMKDGYPRQEWSFVVPYRGGRQ